VNGNETGASHKINDYRDLNVWKASMDLAADIYMMTKAFPREEMFGMTAQMRRAAASIPANIAEGFGRAQRKTFIQFLRIAQGSLKELETHSLLATRVGLLEAEISVALMARCESLGKMIRAFIHSLEKGTGQ
jgi:four helix bundle protein